MRVIDSIRPPQRQLTRKASSRPSQLGTGARFSGLSQKSRRRRRVAWDVVIAIVVSPLLLAVAFVGSLSAMVVPVLGLVAVALKLPSRALFVLALVALLFMGLLQLNNAADTAQAVAVMAYELLAAGVVAMALEIKREARLGLRKKQRF